MKRRSYIAEDISGSNNPSNPSNALFTGQVADNPNRKFFNHLYRRTKLQREMDKQFVEMFNNVMKPQQ